MVTQGTGLANLTTSVSGQPSKTKEAVSLVASFQSYVAASGGLTKQAENTDAGVENTAQRSEDYRKNVYEKEATVSKQSTVKRDTLSSIRTQKAEKPSEDVTTDMTEAIEEDIRTLLKDTLDMDDAELDAVLAELNISVFDLLQPENLQAFLLTATGTEPVELLTNSTLVDTLQELNAGMEQLLDSYGMTAETISQLALQQEQQTYAEALEDESSLQNEAAEDKPIQEKPEERLHAHKENGAEAEKADGFTVQESETGITVQVQSGRKMNGQHQQASSEASQQGMATDIVNQLSQAVQDVTEGISTPFTEVQQAEIIKQVIERIRVTSGNDMNRIEVQLYPEHLGRLQIQVMMKNGTLTAQIHAETEMAKEAIEGQLQQLKETFQEKHIQVEAVEVSVATSDFKREQEGQNTAKDEQQLRTGHSRMRLKDLELPLDEQAEEEEQERLEAQGASVEFTA